MRDTYSPEAFVVILAHDLLPAGPVKAGLLRLALSLRGKLS
jgi:hypothetical protein